MFEEKTCSRKSIPILSQKPTDILTWYALSGVFLVKASNE